MVNDNMGEGIRGETLIVNIRCTVSLAALALCAFTAGCKGDAPQGSTLRPLRELEADGEFLTCANELVIVHRPRDPDGEVFLSRWDFSSLRLISPRSSIGKMNLVTYLAPGLIVAKSLLVPGAQPEPAWDRLGLLVYPTSQPERVRLLPYFDRDQEYCRSLTTSRLGKHVGVVCVEDVARTHSEDFRLRNTKRIRVGIIGPDASAVDWLPPLVESSGAGGTVALPSPTGDYLAVISLNNQTTMLDVKTHKVLWETAFGGALRTGDFTSDGKAVYLADSAMGPIYKVDSVTGKKLGEFRIPQPQGERIISVAVNVDGALLAAGTGPVGNVYILSTETGTIMGKVCHGDTAYNVGLSPDSRFLATGRGRHGRGSVRIWMIRP